IISAGMSQYSDFYSGAAQIRTEQGLINQLKSEQIGLKESRGMAFAYGGNIRENILAGRDSAVQLTPSQIATRQGGGRTSGGQASGAGSGGRGAQNSLPDPDRNDAREPYRTVSGQIVPTLGGTFGAISYQRKAPSSQ